MGADLSVKFLADMGISLKTAAFLHALGQDAVHLTDQGLGGLAGHRWGYLAADALQASTALPLPAAAHAVHWVGWKKAKVGPITNAEKIERLESFKAGVLAHEKERRVHYVILTERLPVVRVGVDAYSAPPAK